jgi:hypothetical protein
VRAGDLDFGRGRDVPDLVGADIRFCTMFKEIWFMKRTSSDWLMRDSPQPSERLTAHRGGIEIRRFSP